MSDTASNRVMSPANLFVPIKSWLEVEEIRLGIRIQETGAVKTTDEVGTLHFDRFVDFHDHNQIGFFSSFDGSLKQYIEDFAKYLGPFFNAIFKHTVGAPDLPVEKNVDSFLNWIKANLVEGLGYYSAYPTLSVQDIRLRAGVAHGGVKGLQTPLTLVMPAKSPNHLAAASQVITQSLPKFYEAADAIGTIHFARFVPMGTTALLFVSEFDGDFDKHIQDCTTHLGPLFDQILANLADAPPTPVQKNTPAFAKWISARNLKPWLFYSAYPTLSVQDIRARFAKVA
jgi:hypothetical protein